MNETKVFKFGTGNDLGISYKCYGFGVERSKVKVTGSQGAKYIEGDQVAGVSLHSVECPASLLYSISIICYLLSPILHSRRAASPTRR